MSDYDVGTAWMSTSATSDDSAKAAQVTGASVSGILAGVGSIINAGTQWLTGQPTPGTTSQTASNAALATRGASPGSAQILGLSQQTALLALAALFAVWLIARGRG